MPLILPNDIEPLTPADAAEVEQNYGFIEQYMNTNVITRDGAVAMTSPLTLAGAPSSDLHAATKAYVDAFIPVGVILPFGVAAAPAGNWHLCDGASLSTSTYPKLFAVIGYRYGGSGGSFKVPNLQGKIPIGQDSAQTRFNTAGKEGGTWNVPVPSHSHSMAHNHPKSATGAQSANHTHLFSHTHPINHDHGAVAATTAGAGSHSHKLVHDTGMKFGDGNLGFQLNGYGQPMNLLGAATDATDTEPAHTHSVSVNLPSFVGSSGGVNGTDSTGSNSASHTHDYDTPNYVGNTALAGTVGAEHLPPYVVISYIIRTA